MGYLCNEVLALKWKFFTLADLTFCEISARVWKWLESLTEFGRSGWELGVTEYDVGAEQCVDSILPLLYIR